MGDVMYLVVVILILLVWAVYGIKEALTPSAPPIENLDDHLKHLASLPTQAARQKYLMNRKPGDK